MLIFMIVEGAHERTRQRSTPNCASGSVASSSLKNKRATAGDRRTKFAKPKSLHKSLQPLRPFLGRKFR